MVIAAWSVVVVEWSAVLVAIGLVCGPLRWLTVVVVTEEQ